MQFVYMICSWGCCKEGLPQERYVSWQTELCEAFYFCWIYNRVKPKPLDNCAIFQADHGVHADEFWGTTNCELLPSNNLCIEIYV